ncbi:MAG: hypothetical protein QOE28_2891, partial [Solirubrobacteraceae bacterium]|nr:hypothetical protein [Solirubrobacteraceae bacterium]
GDERTRTADPLLAKQVLYQLSYVPERPGSPGHLVENIIRQPSNLESTQHAVCPATSGQASDRPWMTGPFDPRVWPRRVAGSRYTFREER